MVRSHRDNMNVNCSSGPTNGLKSVVEGEMRAFQDIPLTALSKNTKQRISNSLNMKKIIRSEAGYKRDWRGLAVLALQKNYCEENILSSSDPTARVLQLWCSNNPKTATFAYLGNYLGKIDRWDIYFDIYENLVEDSQIYQQQRSEVLSEDNSDGTKKNTSVDLNNQLDFFSNSKILTKDDVVRAQNNLPPQTYDAFVLFAEKDINYAIEMIDKLENNSDYHLKLCIKHRDLLTGLSFEHVALMELIQDRCKHLIVVLTREFLKSPENTFLVNYTQALQIQNKSRKIIPLIYEDGVVTPLLKVYTHMRYGVTNSLFDFWSSLATSIRNVDLSSRGISSITANIPKKQSETTETHSSPTVAAVKTHMQNVKAEGNENISKGKNINSNILMDNASENNDSIEEWPISRKIENASNMLDFPARSSTSGKKRRKKWANNLFEKVFSHSTAKLKETA
ncbi:myeloid differentiation primary response protein MyD88 [Glossina fuscipes fuscipes]